MGLFSKLFKKEKELPPIPSEINNSTISIMHDSEPQENNTDFNDYKKTIFLSKMEGKPLMDRRLYPNYFLSKFDIRNCHTYHLNLIKNGYFIKAPIDIVLNSYKLPELKKICDNFSISKKGRKGEIIQRIIDETPQSELDAVNASSDIYTLSEKGTDFILKHSDYIKFYELSDGNITFKDYLSSKKKLGDGFRFDDVMWNIYSENRIKELNQIKNPRPFPSVLYSCYQMHKLLKRENREDVIYYLEYLYSLINSYSRVYSALYQKDIETRNEILKSVSNETESILYVHEVDLKFLDEFNKENILTLKKKTNELYKIPYKYVIFNPDELYEMLIDYLNNPDFNIFEWNNKIANNDIKLIKKVI